MVVCGVRLCLPVCVAGIVTKRECEEVFSSRLDQLRSVLKMRTAVYSAEEKALMVMLEGEQEEERRREQDKLVKHEKEKLLQRKREVDAMLFGGKICWQFNKSMFVAFCW